MRRLDWDVWEEIFVTLTRNKTRSLLTAFGIFWGIFMLVSLMGGAQGLQQMLSREFEGFATNSGFIGSNKTGKAYKGFQQERMWDLENEDVERVRRHVGEVEVITPSLARWGVDVIYGDQKISGTLKGLYPEYGKIEEPLISHGRYLNDMDVKGRRRVCIIGKRIYETLFPGGEDPCGKSVKINGIYYQVVGVSLSAGNISVQGRSETSVIIPFTTMQQNYNFGQKVQLLCYTAKAGYSIGEVEEKVAQVVKRAHYIHPDDDQALVQVNAEAMFSMVDNLFSGVRILGWMIGLGTLLAGAIGVSNIMMVTVKERTMEIGIRRAIGARPDDILRQILSESMVLTVLAGMTGITLAVFLLDAVEQGLSTPEAPVHFQIGFWEAVGACFLLLCLGLLAGLAPAYRAMSVKPIDAIRDE